MSGVNRVIIVGRLGRDPEIKQLEGGVLTKFSVATSESWTGKDGTKQEKTEWHNVTCWGKLAEICGKYLTKGKQVYIEGKLQTRSWEDEAGVKKYATDVVAKEVQFLGDSKQTSSEELGHPETTLDFDKKEEIPNFAPGQSHGPSVSETPGF